MTVHGRAARNTTVAATRTAPPVDPVHRNQRLHIPMPRTASMLNDPMAGP
jgi:hypothetical protein